MPTLKGNTPALRGGSAGRPWTIEESFDRVMKRAARIA